MTPVDWRESLALSRNAGLPFTAAWEIATTEHPLEDFMEGAFKDGRDSEGKDFALWLREVWEGAYTQRPFTAKEKPTRLDPHMGVSEGVSAPYVAPQGHSRLSKSERCKSGDRCDRLGGHGITRRFCEHHAAELEGIRRRHKLDEAFDWGEFSSTTYRASFER